LLKIKAFKTAKIAHQKDRDGPQFKAGRKSWRQLPLSAVRVIL